MRDILLISEDFIKENTNLNENIWPKNIYPVIRDCQEIYLKKVLGDCLTNTLYDLVRTGDISLPENAVYKELLDDYIRYFLLYEVVSMLIPTINFKISNLGAVVSRDEYVVNVTDKEIDLMIENNKFLAEEYKRQMIEFVMANNLMPECGCKALDNKTYHTNLFLG